MLQINKEQVPALFSDGRFIKAKTEYLAFLETEGVANFRFFIKFYKEINKLLSEESQHRCVYCEQKLGITSTGSVDHFFPMPKYPRLVYQWDNLFFSCELCNKLKGPFDPMVNGECVLLHPALDNIQVELSENEDGYLNGNSEKARYTIDFFRLNRPELVEQRLRNKLFQKLSTEGYSAAAAIINNNYYGIFEENIENLRLLLTTNFKNSNQKQLFYNMIYANVITSLETYLSDAFINTVVNNQQNIKKFVETFKDFREIKFEYNSIFEHYESIQKRVSTALLDVIYHNIGKVKGMYKDTLGVEFPREYLSDLGKAISIRHDIVHRNGKDKTGKMNEINLVDIENLIIIVTKFVKKINDQLISK